MAEESPCFLGLSPELRIMIYDLLLPTTGRVHIGLRGKHIDSPNHMKHLTRLSKTNRQVHSEVRPVVYGKVTFKFYPSKGSCTWLRSLGSNIQHLCHIFLDGWIKTRVRSCLHQLKQARSLKTITIAGYVRLSSDATAVAEAFRPFIKEIRGYKAHGGAGDDIVDGISVKPARYPEHWYTADEEKRLTGEYTVALRTELRRLLARD